MALGRNPKNRKERLANREYVDEYGISNGSSEAIVERMHGVMKKIGVEIGKGVPEDVRKFEELKRRHEEQERLMGNDKCSESTESSLYSFKGGDSSDDLLKWAEEMKASMYVNDDSHHRGR